MDMKILTLLVIANVYAEYRFSGTITDNITFFYRTLPTPPSVRAIIEFNVSFPVMEQRTLMGIYTTYPKTNIQKQCSYIKFGQLRNENMHPHLRQGVYRTTFCYESPDATTMHCGGKVKFQDYIPRNFSLTFGRLCFWPPESTLTGLTYNISISDQSNTTSGCLRHTRRTCNKYYYFSSNPNLIGNEAMNQSHDAWRGMGFYYHFLLEDPCYQHTEEFLCNVLFPRCDLTTGRVTHPCKEMCSDFLDGCISDYVGFFKQVSQIYLYQPQLNITEDDRAVMFSCDYLPSRHGNIPCNYKPVTCRSPPEVDNNTVILNDTQRDVYQLHDVIHYSCVRENIQMEGNSTITCLHSGEWSAPPKCKAMNTVSAIHIVLPVLICPLVLFLSSIIIKKVKYKYIASHLVSLTRRRQFDAFVCYSYDRQDAHFAENTIPLQLEQNRGFHLCIHRRDFKAGWDIKWNILNAIENSNSAIIVMSQEYINSLWCLEEFEDCYMENMKDPAFKLFVILTQKQDALKVTNGYIQSFFEKKTYLEKDDAKLFKKIAEYLIWVKKPKKTKAIKDTAEETNELMKDANQNLPENVETNEIGKEARAQEPVTTEKHEEGR